MHASFRSTSGYASCTAVGPDFRLKSAQCGHHAVLLAVFPSQGASGARGVEGERELLAARLELVGRCVTIGSALWDLNPSRTCQARNSCAYVSLDTKNRDFAYRTR